jgi:histidinol-phosphate phosphatase family protein
MSNVAEGRLETGDNHGAVPIRQAVILAGGVGTRLRPLTYSRPKPLVSLNGRPFLEYLVEMLRKNGISEIVLLLGYLHEQIVAHFGDGSAFGVQIRYSTGDVSLETGARLLKARELIQERFLLMYGDNYWPLDLQKLVRYHNEKCTTATVTVYSNKDGTSRNNTFVDDDGYVARYDKSRKDSRLNGVEIGFFVVDKQVFDLMPDSNFSFEREVFPKLIEARQLAGYVTDHKYYSIGSPERLQLTEQFLRPQKIAFLDRDGVINRKAPKAEYIKSWSEFVFLPGAIDGMKLLAQGGYRIFIITNQAGVARGVMTESQVAEIHASMEKALADHGVEIEAVYCCMHGWDDGCECRKPKPGMLLQAARNHHIDLSRAFFIGDDERDLEAGDAAGCRTRLVDSERSLLTVVEEEISRARTAESLGQALPETNTCSSQPRDESLVDRQ